MWTWITKLLPTAGSLITSILPSPWVMLGGVVLVVGAYFTGHWKGDTAGYNRAEVELKASFEKRLQLKQDEIDQLVRERNQKAQELNDRIGDLETKSAADALRIFKLIQENDNKRVGIVTEYETKYVTVAGQCGLSTPSVDAINQILDTVSK